MTSPSHQVDSVPFPTERQAIQRAELLSNRRGRTYRVRFVKSGEFHKQMAYIKRFVYEIP